MSKFTPGPWHTGGTGFVLGKPLVSIWGPTPEGKQSGEWIAKEVSPANARLIAAAPDGYALAEFVVISTLLLGEENESINQLREMANQLIAKVKGETR